MDSFPYHRLIIPESSEILVEKLKSKFPLIKILKGDPKNLSALLGDFSKNIDIIISSLPLLIFPEGKNKIIYEVETLLNPESYYIQYTHGCFPVSLNRKFDLKKIKTKKSLA